jgi:hypothetical protein
MLAGMTEGEYVTVETAGHLTGIPARTIRRWAQGGKVAVTAGQRGRLVRLDDVRRIAAMTGRPVGQPDVTGGSAGQPTGHETVTPSAVAQLDAIRDRWLQPFVDQLTAESEEIGRLTAERDALRAEVARLTAGETAPGASRTRSEAPHAAQTSDATNEPRSRWWAWLRRLLSGS